MYLERTEASRALKEEQGGCVKAHERDGVLLERGQTGH